MARGRRGRRSRSKQRSKGAGSRSASAGKSKGGSRSSAGSKGGSRSGGNRSGSGARGNKGRSTSSSKSTTSSKSKSRSPSRSPSTKSPSTKKPSVKRTPADFGRAPSKTPTKAQQIAKKNIQTYGGTAKAAAANRESMRVNTRSKYLAKQTGIPSGDKLKAGSFGISEAGKALAAKQRAEAQAKKAAEQKAARERAAADAKLSRQFDPRRLLGQEFRSSGDLRNPLNASNYLAAAGAGYTDSVIGGANFVKNLVPGVKNLPNIPTLPKYADKNLQRVRDIASIGIPAGQLTSGLSNLGKLNAARGLSTKGVQAGFTGMGKKGYDAIRSGAKYIASNKPQILGKGAYSAPTFAGASRYAGTTGSLGGKQQAGGVIASIVPGGARRIGMIESQAKVPAATFDKGVSLANKLAGGAYQNSALARRLTGQITSGVAPGGGIGTGGLAATSAVAGSAATAAKATQAGGLNIGSSGGVDSGEPSGSGVGRAINFVRNNPLAIGKDLATLNNQLNTGELSVKDIAQGIGDYRTVMAGKDLREKVGNFADLPNERKEKYLTKGLELADKSAIVQNLGERAGLPSDFKAQTKELGGEIQRRLSTVKAGDRDSTYKAISDFARDVGTDPKLGLAGRMAESFRTRKGTTMEKIAAGYDKNAPTVKGLSAAERGIVGSVGNRILSGKATDMAREAMSGMSPGSSLTRGNVANIASNIIRDTAPGADTVSAKRASEIKSLVTGGRTGRDVTPGSLIRGVNPFRGSNRGRGITPISTAPAFTPSGGGTPVGQVPQIPATGEVPQFQVPEIPVQQGTDAGNLANIQNESYQNTFNNLMAINPNYSARFQMRRRRGGRRGGFRKAFSRRFFS